METAVVTYYGIYQQTTFFSLSVFGHVARPQHTIPYIAKSAWHPVFHMVGIGDVVLVAFALAGQTNFATTLDLSLPTYMVIKWLSSRYIEADECVLFHWIGLISSNRSV